MTNNDPATTKVTEDCDGETVTDGDDLAQLARVIHDQMTTEPKRMHVAIVMAKKYMADIRQSLVEQAYVNIDLEEFPLQE